MMVAKTIPAFLLANRWEQNIDPTGKWMSEKFDGVRAMWIADEGKFVSRDGLEFFAPEFFKANFPPFNLDGELFGGRKKFNETSGIVRQLDGGKLWQDIVFLVIDAPTIIAPFESRVAVIKKWVIVKSPPFLQVISHSKCTGEKHLMETLDKILENGGEGVMLREPGSMYAAGRSSTLLKVKRFYDAEATVIGYKKGTGRNANRTGSLIVRNDDGIEFDIGSGLSDEQRDNPPPIGMIITYKYQEIHEKTGKPRFATFLRIRADVDQPAVTEIIDKLVKEKEGKHERIVKEVAVPIEPVIDVEKLNYFRILAEREREMNLKKVVINDSDTVEGTNLNRQMQQVAPVVLNKEEIFQKITTPIPVKMIETTVKHPEPITIKRQGYGLTEGVTYRFTCIDPAQNHYKFWEVTVLDRKVVASWGRIGNKPQDGSWDFAVQDGAFKHASKKISEKLAKGYARDT